MKKGYFGEFGGCFVPELLMPPLLDRWMKESEHVCLCECTLIFPDMMVGTAGEDGRFAYRPTCGGRAVRFRKAFR